MKRHTLISGLVAGAALVLLGGCAYDDGYYGRGYYGGGGYYGSGYYGSYYDPYYYGSDYYYGPNYYFYGRSYIPRGSYGGGYRYRRDWDGNRGGDHRDFRRGDNGAPNMSRNQPQSPSAQQPSFRGGDRGGDRGGSRPSGGPQGRFGHPGTPNNPL
jgi:hypothetical protein